MSLQTKRQHFKWNFKWNNDKKLRFQKFKINNKPICFL